jgi:uncharacterized repeat protein (TIGR02543 family)
MAMKKMFAVLAAIFLLAIMACSSDDGGSSIHTYKVIYDDNGSTGGSVPIDSQKYQEGDNVTVLGNTSSLVKTDYIFVGWNMQADGNGTTYTEGQDFRMGTANVTLYAKFRESFAGTWHTDTHLDPNNCTADISYTWNENLVVTQSGDNVTVNNGAYTFTGTTNDNNGFTVSGIIPTDSVGCTSLGVYIFNEASNGLASVVLSVSVTCGSMTCSVIDVGTGVRQTEQ